MIYIDLFFAEQAKRRGAFLPLMCVNISLYLGVQPRFHDDSLSFSHFCLFFCLFSCGKQSRYSLLISLCSIVPIISTLLFNSSFSNAIRLKINIYHKGCEAQGTLCSQAKIRYARLGKQTEALGNRHGHEAQA